MSIIWIESSVNTRSAIKSSHYTQCHQDFIFIMIGDIVNMCTLRWQQSASNRKAARPYLRLFQQFE